MDFTKIDSGWLSDCKHWWIKTEEGRHHLWFIKKKEGRRETFWPWHDKKSHDEWLFSLREPSRSFVRTAGFDNEFRTFEAAAATAQDLDKYFNGMR